MNRSISRRRVSSSGARSKAEGCTVASAQGEGAKGTSRPRSRVTRKALPHSACAERHDDLRFDDADLGLEPGKAGLDFDRARFAVNAPRAARHPFEVFDHIGDIGLLAVDPRLHETAVQQPSRRSYEGVSGKIFGVTRLLADQHDPGSLRSFAEHGLRGVLVQIAAGASSGGIAQCAGCRLDRDQVPGIFGWLGHR